MSEGRGNRLSVPGQQSRSPFGRCADGADAHAPLQAGDRGSRWLCRGGRSGACCWCDLRVVEDDAVFGVFCVRWGVPLIDGGTVRLPRLIGQSRALDMILTGRRSAPWKRSPPSRQSRRPQRTEPPRRRGTGARYRALPQMCLKGDRSSVYEQWDLDHQHAMINEFAHGTATLQTGESRSGAARFAGGKGRGGRFDDL